MAELTVTNLKRESTPDYLIDPEWDYQCWSFFISDQKYYARIKKNPFLDNEWKRAYLADWYGEGRAEMTAYWDNEGQEIFRAFMVTWRERQREEGIVMKNSEPYWVADVERLQAEIQRLKDECGRLEAERLDACDLRNLAYIERDNLRALLESVADFLATPWFNDWPTAQAKLSEVESAIANLERGES